MEGARAKGDVRRNGDDTHKIVHLWGGEEMGGCGQEETHSPFTQ